MDNLEERARRWGVETGYHDIFGQWRAASPHALERLTAALTGEGQILPISGAAVSSDPVRAFQGDGNCCWMPAVQLYAVRSRRNWGHGDFSDLANLLTLAAQFGAAGVGLNPLHSLFPERAEEASPYAPNSRLFLNPLYIDVDAIPEFPGVAAAGLADEIVAARASDIVSYARVARAKLIGIRIAYDRFRASASHERRGDFEAYRDRQGDALLRFACFESLRRQYAPASWPEWPEVWRAASLTDLHKFRAANSCECEFVEFAQWIADRQLRVCRETARKSQMPIGLYVDLAVGVHPHGADAWGQQDMFVPDTSIGAPPDEFNPAGQDWGLAPFNPHALAANNFRPIREMLRETMQYAGAIRLDHVLGLNRIYMIPRGMDAANGAYVRYPFEQLLTAVAEESNRCRCIVIGEDLGTVPDGFRETLARWGLWTFRVMLFERQHDGSFRQPEAYPPEAVATFNTHDLPSFRGWLQDYDLRMKRAIGLDPGESDEARAAARQALIAILAARVPDFAPDEFSAVAAFLASTPSRLVTVSLEDVLGVTDQVNIPGTTTQHPNWARKLPVLLEELGQHQSWRTVAQAFAQSGRSINTALS